MKKYAEIYGGLVRDLKESNLNYTEFCSIFSPTSYWLDVTGVDDIEIGYVIKFSTERGTYFEAPAPTETTEETLESKRAGKYELLTILFNSASENAYIDSSLGFRADANETAYRDVDGLIVLLSDTPEKKISFCDYDNLMQTLTLDELKTLQKEIAQNGTYLYQQKWEFRNAIESSESVEDLDKININFNNMIFETYEEDN